MLRNGTNETLVSEGAAHAIAFDPVRRELFWSGFEPLDGMKAGKCSEGIYRLTLSEDQEGQIDTVDSSCFPLQLNGERYETYAPSCLLTQRK